MAGGRDVSPQAHHGIEARVYGAPATSPGSAIAGEHGIGLQKRADLSCSRTPEEIVLMRTLKTALEPRNILNPGKVLAGTG